MDNWKIDRIYSAEIGENPIVMVKINSNLLVILNYLLYL